MITLNTNLKTVLATTQFTNYEFNSFCNFNGKSLATNQSGIFELGGNSDAGLAIDAYFEPVKSDWGTLHPKRCRYLYFGYEAAGPVQLSIGPGFNALITPTVPNRQERFRVTLPKSLVSTYWSYRLANTNGHDFSIDLVEALVIRRSHGFSYSS